MKIIINYGNSSNIPDGIQYGGMKPFYNISQEIEIDDGPELESSIQAKLDRLKGIVESNLLRDMKHFKNIRYKCTCTPTYDGKTYKHSEICLQGTGDSK